MADYDKMYSLLFNAITDALEKIEKQNFGDAKDILIAAQQKTDSHLSYLWLRHNWLTPM